MSGVELVMNTMTPIKIMIDDRNYTSWSFWNISQNEEVKSESININPVEHKLFTSDLFTIDNDKVTIVNSPMRTNPYIAGVLILEDGKTYGRTENKKRLLYRCFPDDTRLPTFLIPYDISIGFSKVNKNKYVIFKFDHWKDKHPKGLLKETIGDVGSLEAFYEYQLYSKSLHISLKDMTNKTRDILRKHSTNEYVQQIFQNSNFIIEDRRNDYIFTIDPQNSVDFDDGFGIKKLENGRWRVSIYLANVFFWLETLGLWNSFSNRVATIYLPDCRRPMLPTILSDTLCSLQQDHIRFAFVIDLIVDDYGIIDQDEYKLTNAMIHVSKNYVYEEKKMMEDQQYKNMIQVTSKIDKTIKNSHELVAFWMIQMNKYCACEMMKQQIGIFRSATIFNSLLREDIDVTLSEHAQQAIRSWNNVAGQYVVFSKDAILEHEILKTKSYIHITSPIRRLVDLLNQMLLFRSIGLVKKISEDGIIFIQKWLEKIDYINTSMRSIRKIQTDCMILHTCFTNPKVMNEIHDGVVFDKVTKNNGVISYMVYLEQLKLLTKINVTNDIENYTRMKFKLYLFENEEFTKKKIRLQLQQG